MIGKTIRNLHIISEIGKGGMGIVYLAEHINLKKRFAVKSLSLSLTQDFKFRERFHMEAQNQALLDHPNIVQATDFFEENNQFFFVMEYVDGQDLGEIIRTKGSLKEKEALSVFKDILKGLKYAHNKGIIHRDVKPSNILVEENGRARITDFGIAVMVGGERLTATRSTVGSPWYMSPEQIVNPKDIDQRSDVYSAGIVLYEILTGDVPFDGTSEWEIQNQQVNAPTPDPSQQGVQISPELAQIILKAMEKVPDKRFQGCDEFLESIKACELSKEITNDVGTDGIWKKVLVVFVTMAIAGFGIVIYKWITQDNNVVVIYNDGHKSAAILIQSALEKAIIICKEFKEIELKQNNLKIAKEFGDTDLLNAYIRQIEEKEQNIGDGIAGYNGFIEELGGMNRTVVDEEFENLTKRLVQKKLSDRAVFNSLVKRHYQNFVNNKTNVDDEVMRQSCIKR